MKNIFTLPNIQAALFLMLSIADTIVLILFKPIHIAIIVTLQIVALLAIVFIRFSYQVALWDNIWHGLWNRKNYSTEDDEPSDFAVNWTRIVGYLTLLGLQITLFLYLGW